MRSTEQIVLGLVLSSTVLSLGCSETKSTASSTFYERKIGPILKETCSNSPTQSGCHVAADNRGNALGNLDLTSYAALSKRSDLLIRYGPYLMPGLLVKAVPPFQVRLTTWESADPIIVTTDIPHAGGSLIDVTSSSFNEIVQWISRGATENNAIAKPKDLERAACSPTVGVDPEFDPTTDPPGEDYRIFESRVSTVLGQTCAAGNCHGSPTNSLYLTCGETTEQKRWNYFAAGDYVSAPPDASELLRRALAPSAGGTYHEGGTLFATAGDPGYAAILEWAEAKGGPTHLPTGEGFFFFAHNVQPMLVKKGCLLIGCHSPAMGHEYRLRSGSGGHFGLPATRRNYALTLEQVALDSPDPNTSRLIRKNLVPYVPGTSPAPQTPLGILHRGGSLFGIGRTDCSSSGGDAGVGAPDAGGVGAGLDAEEPYCVIRRWIELERAARTSAAPGLSSIVYVTRPQAAGSDVPQDFETFTPGGDVVQAAASQAADGSLSVQGGTSLLGACGLPAGVDVRRPAVSWDAARIAFSARESASAPWRIYVVEGGACAPEPTIDQAPTDDLGNALPSNGELVHNFDPAFAPDGRIVFASTRGNVTNAAAFDYQGPQRTPADPSRLNSNLYVVEGQTIRQLTFLLNQEMTPSFLSDGRLALVTEKRAPHFYQLAGRRLNLDGGDYHPLFGQRATIGYRQVTDVVELADKNFAAILFSDPGAAHGAGALGVVNRSLGVDHQSGEPADYLQDPAARDWPNPDFFQHSVRLLDGNGRVGTGGGAYRNPTPLPDGRILVSFAPDVPDLASFPGGFGLVVVDPVGGARSAPVVTDANDVLWPVAVYSRYSRGVYASKLDEPNGATRIVPGETTAEVTILDVPLFASLVFQNTRSKRAIAPAASLEVWEEVPPALGVTSFDSAGSFVVDDEFGRVHVKRRLRGSTVGLEDGSTSLRIPGGIPIVFAPMVQLATDSSPTRHHQLEQMQFYPGERVNQGFRRALFNGVCGSCHGAVSGYETDIAVNPDILTQASRVSARTQAPTDLTATRPTPQGPPFP